MDEIFYTNDLFTLEHTFFAGLFMAGLWTAANIIGLFWDWTWAWIDDAKSKKANPMIRTVAKLRGYKYEPGGWLFYKGGQHTDGVEFFFGPMALLSIAPFLLYFYEFTIVISSTVGLAHVARFARRGKKAFDKHCADKKAHTD